MIPTRKTWPITCVLLTAFLSSCSNNNGIIKGQSASSQTYSLSSSSIPQKTTERFEDWGISFDTSGYTDVRKDADSVFLDLTDGDALEHYGLMVRIFPNDDELAVADWVKEKDNNYVQDSTLTSTTVAGLPAVRYMTYGLYDYDVVAVAHEKRIYMFVGAMFDKKPDLNLDRLLRTVQFTEPKNNPNFLQ